METSVDLTKGIYRRIYSGFLKGKRINLLSIEAEAWFWRIQAVADDFGNMHAEPELVHAATVGRRKGITVAQVSEWINTIAGAGLIIFYHSPAGDKYLHIVGFEEFQPAGRNGRKIRHFPALNDAGCIPVNPDSSNAPHSHSHTDTHTDKTKTFRTAPACAVDGTMDSGELPDPVFPIFPCIAGHKSKSTRWQLTDTHVAELKATYPGVNILQVARELWLWLKDNPSRRKTHGGMRSFLSRNIAKRQNRGGNASNNGHHEARSKLTERAREYSDFFGDSGTAPDHR